MKSKFLLFLLGCIIFNTGCLHSQTRSETFVWPKDPAVMENLKKMAWL
jgi:hypothetical protein